MKEKETGWTIFVVVLTLVLLGVAGWIVYVAGSVLIKVAVAVIAVAGGIITAVANHTLQLEKDRASHALQLEKDRIEAERRAKQENYKELLSKVGDFARRQPTADDALAAAHLASWAFGDLEVLAVTNQFQVNRDRESMLVLLSAVRKSLQGGELPSSFVEKYNADVLFAEETATRPGFKSGKSTATPTP